MLSVVFFYFYAECRIIFTVMLSLIILSVVMMNAIMLSVMAPFQNVGKVPIEIMLLGDLELPYIK